MAFRPFGRPRPRLAEPSDPPPDDGTVRLDDVRRRLEILLAALYGRPVPIASARPAPAPGALRRLFRRPPPHLRDEAAAAFTDGERIHLPAQLPPASDLDGVARYRVMAIGQAERIRRGTGLHAPGDDPLANALYLLAEGAAVDRAIARDVPGVRAALRAERAAALAARPPLHGLTPAEREVEGMLRAALSADPQAAGLAGPSAGPAPEGTAEDAATWARAEAAALRLRHGAGYRGVASVAAWGALTADPAAARTSAKAPAPARPAAPPVMVPRVGAGGQSRGAGGDVKVQVEEGKEGDGQAEGGAADADKKRRRGGRPPAGGQPGEASSDDDEPSNELEAQDAPEDDAADAMDPADGEPGAAERDGAPVVVVRAPAVPAPDVFAYPEWDAWAGGYRQGAATVRMAEPRAGDADWAADELRRHAAVVRRLREQFERLRARRMRLRQQRDGEELDLAACVGALVDLRTGHTVDDRLYASVRPARREMSILLLVDVSGSTVEPVNAQGTRIIDVEKTALLLTGEALDALGDRYAVLTFSGRTAADVRMRTVKGFGERSGDTVRRRVAALQPEGYTRLGAAVRHATALLAAQGTTHRLLLILSDGKPNDDDHYQDRYAVEDSRQAIAEARGRGVFPFCLTVDRGGGAYLARIFGEPGHMILRRPDQLPLALTRVVKRILSA